MKTNSLLLSATIFILFITSSYAECILDMDAITKEQQRCGGECMKIKDLIKMSNCVNECNGAWMRAQDEYYACRKLEQEQKEEDTQEEIVKDTWMKRIVKPNLGPVDLIRDGLKTPFTKSLQLKAGDAIQTGPNGAVELDSEDATVLIGENTKIEVIGIQFQPPKIEAQDEIPWDQDPNYKTERDDWGFWKQLFKDIIDFNKENPPKYLKDCFQGNPYKCTQGIITYIQSGKAWFDKKIQTDYPKANMVMTPTAVINTYGTKFKVEVAQDGATTVTTTEGTVLVTDLMSRKSAIVEANHTITIPRTAAGLNSEELKQKVTSTETNAAEQTVQTTAKDITTKIEKIGTTKVILVITVGILLLSLIMRKIRKRKTE